MCEWVFCVRVVSVNEKMHQPCNHVCCFFRNHLTRRLFFKFAEGEIMNDINYAPVCGLYCGNCNFLGKECTGCGYMVNWGSGHAK